MDQRSDEKLADEQKRNRELLARMEREKQLEIENYSIRYVCFSRQRHFPDSEPRLHFISPPRQKNLSPLVELLLLLAKY